MGLHKNSTGNDIHVIYAFTYVSSVARNAATGLIAADIGKVARQLSDETFWILVDNSPLTWSQISVSSGAGTVSNNDLLLETDIPTPNNTYSNILSGGKVTNEIWVRTSDNSNIKTIDYTYSGSKVINEVRKVYFTDGITITAQLTISYIYNGSVVSSIIVTRDI
jgi:hypothetical protein